MAESGRPITWDAPVRIFHWINALAVLALLAVGTTIFFGSDLEVSNDGKVLLKTTHVLIGYVFVVNLLARLVWGFVGGPTARWRHLLAFGSEFRAQLKIQFRHFSQAAGHRFASHSPLGQISIVLMMICLVLMGATGLVLAGTDIYFPPFGSAMAEWVAAAGVNPAEVAPYRPDLVDEAAYKAMRAFRAPFKEIHEYTYFVLLALVPLHLVGVFYAELKSGDGLISAMITGRRPPRTEA